MFFKKPTQKLFKPHLIADTVLMENSIELPFRSAEKVFHVDSLRKQINVHQALKSEFATYKPPSIEDTKWTKSGLSKIITDDVLMVFNWTGLKQKQSLSALKIFDKTLFGK
jgi:hypothetical protein